MSGMEWKKGRDSQSRLARMLMDRPDIGMAQLPQYAAQNTLPPALEKDFQRDLQFAPGWSDWRRGFIQNYGEAPNTEPGGDYNYRMAWLGGATPGRDPGTGEVHGQSTANVAPMNPVELKAPDHPTLWKQHYMEQFGTNPDVDIQQGKMDQARNDFLNNVMRQQKIMEIMNNQGR